MQVAIPLFSRYTALDAIGPYEVLQRIPSIDVVFLGHRRGEVRSDNGMLGMTCDATFDEMRRPDVVIFPGGIGTRLLIEDEPMLDWVRDAHSHSRFTTSV
jgi:putative intracellular protease/amidase